MTDKHSALQHVGKPFMLQSCIQWEILPLGCLCQDYKSLFCVSISWRENYGNGPPVDNNIIYNIIIIWGNILHNLLKGVET